MNDQLRNSFASVAPQIVASPAKRIQALTGDPDFMTSLARGLAVVARPGFDQEGLKLFKVSLEVRCEFDVVLGGHDVSRVLIRSPWQCGFA